MSRWCSSYVLIHSPPRSKSPNSLQIGKTSAVVLTLSGVLKDILLVMASMGIFGDPVTPTQYFGYSIALGGLLYYRLGGEKLQQLGTQTRLTVGDLQRNHPARVRAFMICTALGLVGLIFYTWYPQVSTMSG